MMEVESKRLLMNIMVKTSGEADEEVWGSAGLNTRRYFWSRKLLEVVLGRRRQRENLQNS